MKSVQQQCEHHHYEVPKSFHLSGHTFRFCWTVQDLDLGLVKFAFGSKKAFQFLSSSHAKISSFLIVEHGIRLEEFKKDVIPLTKCVLQVCWLVWMDT